MITQFKLFEVTINNHIIGAKVGDIVLANNVSQFINGATYKIIEIYDGVLYYDHKRRRTIDAIKYNDDFVLVRLENDENAEPQIIRAHYLIPEIIWNTNKYNL